MRPPSVDSRLQFDHCPETLAEADIIAAVSSPDLGLRLRAIHAIAQLSSSISLPTLFVICQPNNPCQTTAWLACAELSNISCKDVSLLPQILPSILAMESASSQRCNRTIRLPLHKLISNAEIDSETKKSLASLASSLNIEHITTKKRPAPTIERPRPVTRNPAEDRLVHERLDNFPLQTQIELILRCVRLNLPKIEPSNFKDDGESFKKLLQLLLEQDILARDPRLRDPRLRRSIIIPEAQISSDLHLISSAFKKMNEQVQKSGQAAALLLKKSVPEIRVNELDESSRQELKNLAFERMMLNCSSSRVTEAIMTQMLVKYDSSRIDRVLNSFKNDPIRWLDVVLQLGYSLVAAGSLDIYVKSFTITIDALWNAPAGTLSKFLCSCAFLPDEVINSVDEVCKSDNELKRTVALFSLRDLIMKRFADKSKVLQLLLTYCGSKNASLRNPAVALVTQQLLPLGATVENQIIEYAAQLFESISEPFESEIQQQLDANNELQQLDANNEVQQQEDANTAEPESHGDDVPSNEALSDMQLEDAVIDSSAEDRSASLRSDESVKHEDTANGSGSDGEINGESDKQDQIKVDTEAPDPHQTHQTEQSMASVSEADNMELTDVKPAVSAADELIEAEASRRLDLYFSLCSKRHELFPNVLSVFSLVSSRGISVRASFHKNIPKLVCAIGSTSPVLIETFKQSPNGSEPLVLHALHVLTDGVEDLVSPALVEAAQSCYLRCRDARFLIPVLSGMKRAQILEALPYIIALPKIHVEQAFKLLLSPAAPVSPSEVLVRLHIIAPTPEHPLLRKVMDAIQLCIFNKEAYNEKVLAVVLQQVVERHPIPVLFMRTLIQVLAVYPLLTEFAITILAKLVNKRIWDLTNLELWQGFIVCCMRTIPHSYPIMLQLPSSKLAQLIERSEESNKLRVELSRFVQNSRVEVRRSIQSLLGLTRRLR